MPNWLKIVGVIAIIFILYVFAMRTYEVKRLEKEKVEYEAVERELMKIDLYRLCVEVRGGSLVDEPKEMIAHADWCKKEGFHLESK